MSLSKYLIILMTIVYDYRNGVILTYGDTGSLAPFYNQVSNNE